MKSNRQTDIQHSVSSPLHANKRVNNNVVKMEEKKQETQLSLTNRTTRLEVSQGHITRYYSMCVRYGFLLVCYSNFVPKTHHRF